MTGTGWIPGVEYRWLDRDPVLGWIPFVADFVALAEVRRGQRRFVGRPAPGGIIREKLWLPARFRYNGSSGGFPLGRDLPEVMRATAWHDLFYRLDTRPHWMTQDLADGLFFDDLDEDGAPRWFCDLAGAAREAGVFRFAWDNGIS